MATPVTRIAVHGASGSGKTTLAAALATRLGVARTELDGLYHQPGWTQLPTDEFRSAVAEVVDGPGWVVDGNYRQVRDLVWARAGAPHARVVVLRDRAAVAAFPDRVLRGDL